MGKSCRLLNATCSILLFLFLEKIVKEKAKTLNDTTLENVGNVEKQSKSKLLSRKVTLILKGHILLIW